MQRVTLTLDDELVSAIDDFMQQRRYGNRSEAVRDLVRGALSQQAQQGRRDGPVVAALVYMFEHATRELPKRLTRHFHDHHAATLSTLHVHLDHDTCLEVAILQGDGRVIGDMADAVIAARGVTHDKVVTMPLPAKHPPRTERAASTAGGH